MMANGLRSPTSAVSPRTPRRDGPDVHPPAHALRRALSAFHDLGAMSLGSIEHDAVLLTAVTDFVTLVYLTQKRASGVSPRHLRLLHSRDPPLPPSQCA